MFASSMTLASMMALAVLAAQVNGHGYMSDPAVTFLSNAGDPTQYIATIESSASGFSGTFSSDPATNTASFTTAFAASDYTSLKEFVTDLGQLISVDGVTITCGLTDPDETAQALPETYVEWAHSDSEGFTASHEGPCEVWCDDTRVFQEDDCAATYTTAPAQLPYDRDACLGASQLTFYWLALHSSTWQVYINCAALEETTSTGVTSSYAVGSTSTSTSTASNSTSTTTTTTEAPVTTTTEAPVTTTATPTTTTATPTTTTATPTTTTAAPSTTSAPTSITSTTTATTTTTAPSTASTGTTSTSTWPSSSTPSTTTATTTDTVASGQTNSTGNGATNSGWSASNTNTGNSNTGSNNNNNIQGGMWTGGMSFGFNQ